ncbi:hypothetical protein CF326_g3880 [Tilletia indica]|nr:hypothetical protein CF326_g3880 [Tilletia indica]
MASTSAAATATAGGGGLAGNADAGHHMRRKKVSYEVYDDENADGGPTPAPNSNSTQDHPRKRQRLEAAAAKRRQQATIQIKLEQIEDGDGDDVVYVDQLVADGRDSEAGRISVEAEARPKQLLPVANLRDFSGSPVSGDQYLALVRREARRAPTFTRAHNPYDRSPPQQQDQQAASSSASGSRHKQKQKQQQQHQEEDEYPSPVPDAVWRKYQIRRFTALRHALHTCPLDDLPNPLKSVTLPDETDRGGWFAFIHNKHAPRGVLRSTKSGSEEAEEMEGFNVEDMCEDGRKPHIGTLRRLTQSQIRTMLKMLSDIIPSFSEAAQVRDFNSKYPAQRSVLLPLHAQWIFSLLAMLDAHLISDHLNELRNLARTIIFNIAIDRFHIFSDSQSLKRLHDQVQAERQQRAQEGVAHEDEDQEGNYWPEEYERLYEKCKCKLNRIHRESSAWMLVSLIAGFWAQHDLLDEANNQFKRPETR